jgi:hypothetical protein
LVILLAPTVLAANDNRASAPPALSALAVNVTNSTTDKTQCLPNNKGFLRAKLNGSINNELSWDGANLSCAGSVRPDNGGVRLRFTANQQPGKQKLVLLFGISGLSEGADGKALPANLTIMVEGAGEFYATQGDSKCTIDSVQQIPLNGIPLRQRAYQVTARGFCTQPARALNGDGSVLVNRFDFSGRVDFSSDETDDVQPAKP